MSVTEDFVVSLFNTAAIVASNYGWDRRRRRHKADDGLRICRFEQMEPRQLMTAAPPQIHFGSVFFDPSPGTSTTPNTIQITFQGGAPGTQLTQLIIDGSKNQTRPGRRRYRLDDAGQPESIRPVAADDRLAQWL